MPKEDERAATLSRGEAEPADQRSLTPLKALLNEKSGDRSIKEDHMLSVLFVRRARAEVLGKELFSDPAWDLLLELYAARLGKRTVRPCELAAATDTPLSTTARWIAALTERGLVETFADPVRPARTQIRLSEEGLARMQQLGDRWVSAFLSI